MTGPVAPVARGAAARRDAPGAASPAGSGASARRSTAPPPSSTAGPGSTASAGRGNFATPTAPTAPPRPRVLRLRGLQARPRRSCWEPARPGGADHDELLAELTALIAGAQDADGYLHTAYGRPGQPQRYSDLNFGHELYCAGHLLQAAVAGARTGAAPGAARRRPPASPTTSATSFADEGFCGHPEIEPGLVELFRVTGERRYLDQAAKFVEPGAATAACPSTSSAGSTSRTTVRSATARCSAATPYARCTSPPAPSTWRWRPATRSCSRPSPGSSTGPSPGAPTSPAAWAPATSTSPSATTSRCRPTGPTPRPAPASPPSCWPTGCCWPPATCATATSSSGCCTT